MEHAYLRSKVIDSIKCLWDGMMEIESESSQAVFMLGVPRSILEGYFSGAQLPPGVNVQGLDNALSKYRDPLNIPIYGSDIGVESHRLFVGQRLWNIFFAFRAFHGRLCFLIHDSYRSEEYIDWQSDEEIIGKQLTTVFGDEAMSVLQEAIAASRSDSAERYIQDKMKDAFLATATEIMLNPEQLRCP